MCMLWAEATTSLPGCNCRGEGDKNPMSPWEECQGHIAAEHGEWEISPNGRYNLPGNDQRVTPRETFMSELGHSLAEDYCVQAE